MWVIKNASIITLWVSVIKKWKKENISKKCRGVWQAPPLRHLQAEEWWSVWD
jgi:hypothetical protein